LGGQGPGHKESKLVGEKMSRCDLVSDLITRIRNASSVKKESTDVLASSLIKSILEIILREGYIDNFKLIEDKKQGLFRVYLKYDANGRPALRNIKRISKLSLRKYVKSDKIKKVLSGYGFSIISTSHGVMTDKEARDLKVGGEIICNVW
jgi:small subunit ribosomal protein S8